jgi:hypothetical protein
MEDKEPTVLIELEEKIFKPERVPISTFIPAEEENNIG